MNPQSGSDNGTQFQCDHYSPLSVYDRHCKFYRDGNCNKTGQRCVEWLRKNPNTQPQTAEVDLFGHPIPEHKPRSNEKPQQSTSSQKPTQGTPQWSTPKQAPLSGFSKELIESFKKLKTEICFTSDTGRFWLVPEYRDPSRGEITPEHLAFICNVLTAFPGATVVAFETIHQTKGEQS